MPERAAETVISLLMTPASPRYSEEPPSLVCGRRRLGWELRFSNARAATLSALLSLERVGCGRKRSEAWFVAGYR